MNLKKYRALLMRAFLIVFAMFLGIPCYTQVSEQRADNIQNGLFMHFMSSDQSYYKRNNLSDNDPYGYGYWVTAHALETLADAFQRTRNDIYYNQMKSILAGIRKYNLYGAGTYHNDYYDDLEWLCLACFNCYNATKDVEFLNAVHDIWAEIKTGYNTGKMSWRKGCSPPCYNSIANSPAIVIAVKLYKLEHDETNLQMARDIHAWMKTTVFNANGGIWDAPNDFKDDWQFSYNSGMFITASLELNIVTGTQAYLDDAIKATEFMMNFRSYNGSYNGAVFFLNEVGQGDGGLFKGIFAKSFIDFVRQASLTQAQKDRYLQMINYTGEYVWSNAVNKSTFLVSPNWSVLPGSSIDLSTQVSGVHLFESIASLNKVHVYQDINYAGFYSQLAPGNYTTAQLQAKGISDNDVTSMTIPDGYAVTIYDNDDFTGDFKTYTANTTWLDDWNDKISAMRIVDISGPVSVYEYNNFQGAAAGLEAKEYTMAQLQDKGIADNTISSMKIIPGFKVVLYENDQFTGASAEFTSAIGDLAAWAEKASSLRIEDLRGPVSAYSEVNFTGRGIVLAPGSYTRAQLQGKGMMDNDLASLKVAPGYLVTVYEDDNFLGESLTFDSDTDDLAAWNDKISAVRVADARGPVTVYSDVDFAGYAVGLDVANYSLAQFPANGISDNDVASLRIAPGFKVTLYDEGNFIGAAGDFISDNASLAEWNDKASSVRVRINGDKTLSGIYEVQNRSSSLYMAVDASSAGNGAAIVQEPYTGNANQLFLFKHLGEGVYSIVPRGGNKALEVAPDRSKATGTDLRQWDYYGFVNQQFIAVRAGNDDHQLAVRSSGKLIDAGNDASSGTILRLQENTNQGTGMWKLSHPVAVDGDGDGLDAAYFNGMNFETERLTRKDATINFDWGSGSPDTSVPNDAFSIRWLGKIQPRYSGTYTFYTIADDGVRLWINNQLIIDKWRNDGGSEVWGDVALTAGLKYDIKLEYFENGAGAKVKLEWVAPAQLREVVPQTQLYSLSGGGITAVEENEFVHLTGHPNPVGATLYIDGLKQPAKLELYNMQGQLVRKEFGISMNVAELNPGMYLLVVASKNSKQVVRIVKR